MRRMELTKTLMTNKMIMLERIDNHLLLLKMVILQMKEDKNILTKNQQEALASSKTYKRVKTKRQR